MEGLSPDEIDFLVPKKSLGLGARDIGLAFALDLGLEAALGNPVGLKVLAAGLGLKTLNLAEAADVGVRTVLDACELGTWVGLTAGLEGFWAG